MEATTDDKIKILCLKSLNNFIELILPFRNLYKKFLKFIIEEWASADTV